MKQDAKFESLFQEVLEDMYDAEKQIVGALPKMIAASSSEELSTVLSDHLAETKEQVTRLETLFERMAAEPGTRVSKPMQALIAGGERFIGEMEKSPVLDAALIAAARQVEHHEMAVYTTLCGLAEMLGQSDSFDLLSQSLDEESEADAALAEIAEAVLSGSITEED